MAILAASQDEQSVAVPGTIAASQPIHRRWPVARLSGASFVTREARIASVRGEPVSLVARDVHLFVIGFIKVSDNDLVGAALDAMRREGGMARSVRWNIARCLWSKYRVIAIAGRLHPWYVAETSVFWPGASDVAAVGD